MDFEQWKNFNKNGEWTKEIDVRSFIQANYKPYTGDATFLADATEKTKTLTLPTIGIKLRKTREKKTS